jgi:hypothetical protein
LSTCLIAPNILVCGFVPYSDTSAKFLDDGVAVVIDKGVKKLYRYERKTYGSDAIIYKIIEPSESYYLVVGRDGTSHLASPGSIRELQLISGGK